MTAFTLSGIPVAVASKMIDRMKRNPQKYSPARVEEKVAEMKRRIFRGKEITKRGLSMEDM